MAVTKISDNDISAVESSGVAVLDISATWCGPCKMIAPVVDELADELEGKVAFFNADADENPDLTRKLKVRGIPTLIVFKEGQPGERHVGFQSAQELREWIEARI